MSAPRKPANHATAARRLRLPGREVRRRIWEQACDLVASGEHRDLSRVLASRFHTSHSVIAACLALEGMRYTDIEAVA
jgi:hypothetical protein